MFRSFEANSWAIQRKREMFKKAVQQARERGWLVCRSLGEGWRPFSTFPEKDEDLATSSTPAVDQSNLGQAPRTQHFMRRWIISLLLALMGMGCSVESHAKELGTQTIEQRAQQAQEGPTLAVPLEEFILTGEEDLVLLRRSKLFTLESNSSY